MTIFEVADNEVRILPANIRNGVRISDKEMFYDFFATKYQNQQITITASDGENLGECGLFAMMEELCTHGLVAREKILFRTHDIYFQQNFRHEVLPHEHFWATGTQISSIYNWEVDFNRIQNISDTAKFVGMTVGRFTMSRFRMAYELDQAFDSESFIVYNPTNEKTKNFLDKATGQYQKEINWLETRMFDKDTNTNYDQLASNGGKRLAQGTIDGYIDLWPKFKIEAVAETEMLCNYWFTEKTSRCLITGKPFVLLSGRHSLKRLKQMQFRTFDSVIDESYDEESVPAFRIAKIIKSLKELHNSPDCEQKIQELYRIAKLNQKIYPKLRKVYGHKQI